MDNTDCGNLKTKCLALAPCIVSSLSISNASSQQNIVEILEMKKQQKKSKLISHSFIKISDSNITSDALLTMPSTSTYNVINNNSTKTNFENDISCSLNKNGSTLVNTNKQRPFQIFVKNWIFTVDAALLSRLSSIFSLMFCGGEFSVTKCKKWGKLGVREIVDEKVEDMRDFFECLHSHTPLNYISEKNFSIFLRLAQKYHVKILKTHCEQFIKTTKLINFKSDQVLTLLITANNFNLKRSVISSLILRLAEEELQTLTRLKVDIFLPENLYNLLFSTNNNVRRLRELQKMNGHVFCLTDGQIQFLPKLAFCNLCNYIVDETSHCTECNQTFCEMHWKKSSCKTNYGARLLKEISENLLSLNNNDDSEKKKD